MPVPTKLTVPATEVQKGDLYGHLDGTITVYQVESKTKWTTIRTCDRWGYQKNLRVLNATPICITREVPTAEETEAAAAARRVEMNDAMLREALRQAARSCDKVNEALAHVTQASRYGIEHQWSAVTSYIAAIAEREPWVQVLGMVGHTWGSQSDRAGDRVTFADAIREHAKVVTMNLLNNFNSSHSTNEVSNACRSEARDANASWLNNYAVKYILRHDDV